MTDWRDRRLGTRARPWMPRKKDRSQGSDAAVKKATPPAAPLIITVALRQTARDHAEDALKTLAELLKGASSEHVRVSAANAILDRALGKPLPGSKAAEEAVAEEEEEEGPLDVRWLNSED
jgi:hypothetical protein